MEVKKHFKLFKAGKKWCTLAIVTVAAAAGMAFTAGTVSADTTVSTQPAVDQPASSTATTGQQTSASGTDEPAAQPQAGTANDQGTVTNTDNQASSRQVDYQTPVNAGAVDSAQATDQGAVEFSGWHATNQYRDGMHHFVIVLDSNNQELYRHEVTAFNRPDVQKVYPTAPIAGQGGFKIDVPADKLANASAIRLVSRYTNDPVGNPAGGADYWFPLITTKAGHLDQFQVVGHQVVAAGWDVDDQSASKTEHTVILFDQTKNREVARAKKVQAIASPDLVAAGYGRVANGQMGRFKVSFDITPEMMGDQLTVLSRYNLPGQEDSDYSDYWFGNSLKLNNNGNAGHLDNITVDQANRKITVNGWNANDNSAAEPVHEIILFDKTTNKEITRQVRDTVASPDVAKYYGNIYNADQSRFSAAFDLTPEMLNHQLIIISRYAQAGKDNTLGDYSDYWYPNVIDLTTNKAGHLDNFVIDKNSGKVNIAGWEADDASTVMPTHFIILFDRTANHEIGHQIVTDEASPDITNSSFHNIANAGKCRFNLSFKITPEMVGHELVVVSRYSDSTKADDYGHYSDYWFNDQPITFNVNQAAHLDNYTLDAKNKKIIINGWHADDASVYMPGHYIILFDKTANHEVAHKLVPLVASPDVANVYGQIIGAGKSRFSVSFDLTPEMLNHTLTVISRYSNSNNDNYGTATSDYWFSNEINLDSQNGWLDELSQSGNTINVAGWHVADSTVGLTHHVILLYDFTKNREISRHEVEKLASDDLAASQGNYVNYRHARFNTSFTIDPSIAHDCFGIISRYSNEAAGEGTYSQYWMTNRYLNAYQNPSWMYQIQYSQIQANPAEVGHSLGPGYEGVKTWFVKSKLGDANIHNQYTVSDAYAIMNIQRQHGLPATGWVDLPTWRALGYSDDLWYGIDSYVSPTLTNPAATRADRINAMINTAYHYLGRPWWAGCSSAPSWGVDCSGLVMQALYGAGINPTTVSSTHHGYPGNEWNSRNLFVDPHFQNVSWNDRQRGDLVFYYEPGTRTIWHVAILLDPNTVIESWPPSVMVQPILNGQRNVVAGIRRVFA